MVKAKFYVNALLTDLKDTGADLRSINDWSGNLISQTVCFAKIMSTIVGKTAQLPKVIVSKIENLAAVYTNLVINFEQCAQKLLINAAFDAAEDIAQFTVCAY